MHVIAKWIEREQAKSELLNIRSALIVLLGKFTEPNNFKSFPTNG